MKTVAKIDCVCENCRKLPPGSRARADVGIKRERGTHCGWQFRIWVRGPHEPPRRFDTPEWRTRALAEQGIDHFHGERDVPEKDKVWRLERIDDPPPRKRHRSKGNFR